MKKCVDGIIRDMTPEEEAEHISREYPSDTDPELNDTEAMEILMGGAI